MAEVLQTVDMRPLFFHILLETRVCMHYKQHGIREICQINHSINQGPFRVVHVIKSLQGIRKIGNTLRMIDDNVRERGREQKCCQTEGGQKRSRDHNVRQMVDGDVLLLEQRMI